jgi:hypothetical protein
LELQLDDERPTVAFEHRLSHHANSQHLNIIAALYAPITHIKVSWHLRGRVIIPTVIVPTAIFPTAVIPTAVIPTVVIPTAIILTTGLRI